MQPDLEYESRVHFILCLEMLIFSIYLTDTKYKMSPGVWLDLPSLLLPVREKAGADGKIHFSD